MSIMNGRNFARQARDYLIEEQKRVAEARRSTEPAPKPPRRPDEAAQNQVEGRK